MDYTIVNDSDYAAFIRRVNAHLKAGYEPCGGLVIHSSIAQEEDVPSPVFYQALVQRESDNEPKSDFMDELGKV
jgi:hypothetical protein